MKIDHLFIILANIYMARIIPKDYSTFFAALYLAVVGFNMLKDFYLKIKRGRMK